MERVASGFPFGERKSGPFGGIQEGHLVSSVSYHEVDVRFLLVFAFAWAALAADAPVSLRGHLIIQQGKAPLIDKGGARISLEGDEPTMLVLNDERLANSDFEVLGHYTSSGHFAVDHMHTRSLFLHKDGKRLVVSYWCDVCYIRTSSPGKCWCCQKYTDLDPIEPEH